MALSFAKILLRDFFFFLAQCGSSLLCFVFSFSIWNSNLGQKRLNNTITKALWVHFAPEISKIKIIFAHLLFIFHKIREKLTCTLNFNFMITMCSSGTKVLLKTYKRRKKTAVRHRHVQCFDNTCWVKTYIS